MMEEQLVCRFWHLHPSVDAATRPFKKLILSPSETSRLLVRRTEFSIISDMDCTYWGYAPFEEY